MPSGNSEFFWILLIYRVRHEMLRLHLDADTKWSPSSQLDDFPITCSRARPGSEARFWRTPPVALDTSLPTSVSLAVKWWWGSSFLVMSETRLSPSLSIPLSSCMFPHCTYFSLTLFVSLGIILPPSIGYKLNSEGACLLYSPLYIHQCLAQHMVNTGQYLEKD